MVFSKAKHAHVVLKFISGREKSWSNRFETVKYEGEMGRRNTTPRSYMDC